MRVCFWHNSENDYTLHRLQGDIREDVYLQYSDAVTGNQRDGKTVTNVQEATHQQKKKGDSSHRKWFRETNPGGAGKSSEQCPLKELDSWDHEIESCAQSGVLFVVVRIHAFPFTKLASPSSTTDHQFPTYWHKVPWRLPNSCFSLPRLHCCNYGT